MKNNDNDKDVCKIFLFLVIIFKLILNFVYHVTPNDYVHVNVFFFYDNRTCITYKASEQANYMIMPLPKV